MPAFIGLADSWKADVYGAGHMGAAFEPVKGNELPGRLALPNGMTSPGCRTAPSSAASSTGCDATRCRRSRWPQSTAMPRWHSTWSCRRSRAGVRPRTRAGHECATPTAGSASARRHCCARLVEAGTTFVLVSGAVGLLRPPRRRRPAWGGIQKGLTPILPTIDRPSTPWSNDLEARGLLESTLVLMLGEFGRSPVMTKDAGRDHWTNVHVDAGPAAGCSTGR